MTKRVVIVDDDKWLAQSYARTLEAAGYTVVVARDGRAAIDMIDDELPAAIVLDMLLTGTTGVALLHELQSHSDLAKIPVIVVTNLAEQLPSAQLAAYGVREVLSKPTLVPSELAAAVRRATS